MRKLALTDEILLKVEKPARYLGNEINRVMKNANQVEIRFAMCFPDVYEIGMSHLGIQILYDLFNRREDTWCERVYSPWVDLDRILREKQIPLFALESQDPVREFDFLGITLQYEMCYTNVLQVLELSQIPLHARERTNEDPIVIGGGPCASNPEPLADFFDLFYIGEGET
ncbi:MAG: B12-binding domain-containing radical SAM protein, partial [Lachnospiraceae bacterium]|nr:B12-binding domain-containing radical SAM protein [Lachnospiraceae bacterium]